MPKASITLPVVPCEDRHIEVHVRRDNRGFSRKVFDDLRKEEAVRPEGPHGNFVMKLDSRRPVLFIAWEDGFAPIKSLVQHAMSLEIAEAMYLYWAADGIGHYQDNLCRAWTDALDDFVYQPLPIASGAVAVADTILAHHPTATGRHLRRRSGELSRCPAHPCLGARFVVAGVARGNNLKQP
jgi:CDP-4-dehydro-6-deoxyglucose reductase